MTRPCAGGRIEVICGCMFSGKTEELIRRMRQVQIARQPCKIFTPRLDTRYSSSHVASHSGARLEAVPVSSIKEVVAGCEGLQVIAIDELHFLEDSPEEIVVACQELADRGLRVLVAGLDQSYRAEPFPAISQLMAL
ncbi:MAG: thymidine kinase, partial [Oscillochloris sp.]|nr:thymidine kinase [Oscillochloris sp.]